LLPPLQVTPSDHEGGGFVQIFQVKGDKMVKETDWFNAYRDLVLKAVNAAS
jgi:branched-chain amino acid transport system substrate-binding protein